uniref:Proteasome subunit alpha type n=1 Tax=Globodera rostochiensis TaxID=31243 RepID=A0A914I814_GLORO
MTRGSSAGYDRHITIFSPEGRIYQVEYAFKAVNAATLSAVGVALDDTAVIAVQRRIPDKLVDPSSVKSIYKLSSTVSCGVIGIVPDAVFQVRRAQSEAAKWKYENGYEMPISELARKMAEINQYYTQVAELRSLGTLMLMVSFDDEKGASVYSVDPAGHFISVRGYGIGVKQQLVNGFLEKKLKAKDRKFGEAEVIQLALEALQHGLGIDLKSGEVEVIVEKKATPNGEKLDSKSIEEHLTAIAEKD